MFQLFSSIVDFKEGHVLYVIGKHGNRTFWPLVCHESLIKPCYDFSTNIPVSRQFKTKSYI